MIGFNTNLWKRKTKPYSDEDYLQKSIINIIFKNDLLKVFPLVIKNETRNPSTIPPFLSNIELEDWDHLFTLFIYNNIRKRKKES